MIGLLFTLICLLLLGLSGWLFYHGVRKTERCLLYTSPSPRD